MRQHWWQRSLGILLVATLQLSAANIFFPDSSVPGLVLTVVMAVVIVRGFREGLGTWLALLVVYDLLRSGTLTLFTPFGISAAYLTSFISRRFIFERRGFGVSLIALLAAMLAILYASGLALLDLWLLSPVTLWRDGLLIGVTFFPVLFGVQWFERRMEALSRAEFRGLRR